MRRILKMIDEDIVCQLNRMGQALPNAKFSEMLNAVSGFRVTWLKLVVPLLALTLPAWLVSEPIKTIWLIACGAVMSIFFSVYFYRYCKIVRQWKVDPSHVLKVEDTDR